MHYRLYNFIAEERHRRPPKALHFNPSTMLAYARESNNAMAFIPVPNTVMAELRFLCHGQRVENTLYFQKAGGWGVPDSTTLANNLLVWWSTLPSVMLCQAIELNEIVVSDLSTANSFQVTLPAPTPHPKGDLIVDSAPNNVSMCVSFRTGNRGRSFRGRNYLVGLPETEIIDSSFQPAITSYMQGAYSGIPSNVTASGGTWVVVSRFANGAPRVAGVSTPVTAVVIVDAFVDSQRRRLPGRGT